MARLDNGHNERFGLGKSHSVGTMLESLAEKKSWAVV